MNVIETTTTAPKKNPLEAICEQSFTIQLSGFEALALYKLTKRVGGKGALRRVFSEDGSGANKNDFETKLGEIEGMKEALVSLDNLTYTQNAVYFWDKGENQN